MRTIEGHKVNPVNDTITIEVMDEPGAGGACHEYVVKVPGGDRPAYSMLISFQNGPIAESGVNGLTHEALLAILVDRLEHFQRGKFACRENAIALTKIQEAQHWLHHRTKARMDRGVEGTHKV